MVWGTSVIFKYFANKVLAQQDFLLELLKKNKSQTYEQQQKSCINVLYPIYCLLLILAKSVAIKLCDYI